jgi:hypothetical protein
MKKATKQSLAKIKPAEYTQSAIAAVESQLMGANNKLIDSSDEIKHLRSVVNTLTNENSVLKSSIKDVIEKSVRPPIAFLPETISYFKSKDAGYDDGYAAGRRDWYKFWRK